MKLPLSLGALSGANLVLVFLFQAFVLVIVGPGVETDALFAGMALPQLVLAVISGSLMHVLVPYLAGEEENRIQQDTWGIFIVVGVAFGFLSVALYIFAPFWVPWIVPGFSQAGKTLTVLLTRIQLIGVAFTALTGVLWAVYHARQQFLWAESSPLLPNLLGLGCLIWALPRFGITAVAWILVLRTLLHLLLLLPGLPAYRKPNWRSPNLSVVWRRIKPLLLGSAYYKTDLLVDRFLSSMAPAGGLSLLYLAQQVYGAANEIINKAIAAPMVPLLAGQAKSGNWTQFHGTYRKRLLWMCILTGGGYVTLLLGGKYFLKILIGHGGVTEHNIALLQSILICLGGIFIGGALGQILSTAFYALTDTITPTKIGTVVFTLGIALKIFGFFLFGILGIAIGSSLHYSLAAAALFVSLENKLRDHEVSA
jgi:putative peptidoglycan lipid II flippase